MSRRRPMFLLVVSLLFAPATAAAAGRCGQHPWCDTSLSPDVRAQVLLGQMTQDEKIAFVGGDDDTGVAGGEGTHTGTQLGVPRLDLPTIFYSDGPQGPRAGQATALPGPMALAASFDPALAQAYGAEVGDEVAKKGNDVVFAPTINLMRTPLGGRTFEGYGEDPLVIARTAVGWIKGAQSQGVIANVKHFAANQQEGIGAAPVGVLGAAAVGDRLTVDARVDERTLRETELVGFEAAVKAGVGTVMCSYNRVNGTYACENGDLIHKLLEQEWGFEGYVLADYGAAHNTIGSLNGGLAYEPFPGVAYTPALVTAAVGSGTAGPAVLDALVKRELRTLFAFGVLDHPTIPYDNTRIDQVAHKAFAGQVSEQATVLLKNDGAALPLQLPKLTSLALIGSDADTFKNRGGSAGITPFAITTPRQAITARAQAAGAAVSYSDGSDAGAAATAAQAADVAVVFASDSSIEGKDKTCLNLSCPTDLQVPTAAQQLRDQDALIAAVAAANKNTIVVLETGGPVLTPWRDSVPAILEAWDPGEDGGNAIARVLFGDVDPGGRLPVTFPVSADDEPTAGDLEAYPGVGEQVTYKEGVFVGYRFFDERRKPVAFAFGHGLSYTTFALSDLRLYPGPDAATVSVRVQNTGTRAGVAVPQLYLGLPDVSPAVQQPPRQLKGFEKLRLAPGEAKRASFPLDDRAFSYWDTAAHAWRVQPGCYAVQVGSSSRDLPLRGTIGRGATCDGQLELPLTATACTSRRVITIRLPKGLRSARVTYAGKAARVTRRRGRLTARVDLRTQRAGRIVVRVRGRSATGGPVTQTRVFRTCVKRATRRP